MKHSFLKTSTCLVLSFILLFTSCQKQIDTAFEEPVTKDNFVAESKAWFASGPVMAEKKMLELPFTILPQQAPQRLFARINKLEKKLIWEDAKLYNNAAGNYIIVPLNYSLKPIGENYELARAAVFYKTNTDPIQMNIVEVLSKRGESFKGKQAVTIEVSVYNKLAQKNKSITGIDADVFFYNDRYRRVASFELNAGQWSISKNALQLKANSNINLTDNNTSNSTSGEACQLWGHFRIYWENGVMYEELLYTFYVGDCSGGGSGNPTEEPSETAGGAGEGSQIDEDGDEYYMRQGSLQKTVYLIATPNGGGTCKVTQHLFARFYTIRSDKDKITNCCFIRNDIYNNNLGATSSISVYQVSGLHTNSLSVSTGGSLTYPDGGSFLFNSTISISMGEVSWSL